MKVYFQAPFFDLNNKKIEEANAPAHLGEAAANALIYPGDGDKDFASKAKKFDLAMRVVQGGTVEVTPEECVMIKQSMGLLYGALICGQAERVLNGST